VTRLCGRDSLEEDGFLPNFDAHAQSSYLGGREKNPTAAPFDDNDQPAVMKFSNDAPAAQAF
jgi:hypothetical protein